MRKENLSTDDLICAVCGKIMHKKGKYYVCPKCGYSFPEEFLPYRDSEEWM